MSIWKYIKKWLSSVFASENLNMKHIILFGPPGSGKGTQATKLAERFNLVHISTGDLFRYEIGNSTPLGLEAKSFMDKGMLVPDSITVGMLKNKVEQHPDAEGFILDGFPRTIPQAEALDEFLASREESVNGLISLNVTDEEIVGRLLERGKSSGRSDDSDESIIRNRIKVYKEQTSPVFDFYAKKDLSKKVEGMGSIEEIFDRLSTVIQGLK